MPRKPNFKPFKRSNGWHVYSPLDGGVMDLKTDNSQIAGSKAQALKRHYDEMTQKNGGKLPKTAAESPRSRTAAPKQPSAQAMLNTWSTQSDTSPSESESPSSPSQLPEKQPTSETSPTLLAASSPAPSEPSRDSRVATLMPEDRRRRLADLCAKGLEKVGVLLVGVGVRVFGRVPSPDVDPEERDVMREGISLWMEEVFVDHPPRPWMVVGGAAVGIGIGMYVDGTPIERNPAIKPPNTPGVTVEE